MATSSDPNSSLPIDWTNLYGHNQTSAGGASINISSMTSLSMPDLTATSGSGSPPGLGRVGKSPRRRSRASRRAPVTLLNTDTSNFRAMVQQFTGIPSSSSSSGVNNISGSGGPTISFSAPNINTMRPGGGGVMSFGGGAQPQQYQYQYQNRQPPFQEQIYHSRQHPQQQQQQQQQYDEYGAGENINNNNMFIDGARAGTGAGAGGFHDMHVNEGIFGDNGTNIHLRAHDQRYFG